MGPSSHNQQYQRNRDILYAQYTQGHHGLLACPSQPICLEASRQDPANYISKDGLYAPITL